MKQKFLLGCVCFASCLTCAFTAVTSSNRKQQFECSSLLEGNDTHIIALDNIIQAPYEVMLSDLSTSILEAYELEQEISKQYVNVYCSKVCSDANKEFHKLASSYNSHLIAQFKIKKTISLCETYYSAFDDNSCLKDPDRLKKEVDFLVHAPNVKEKYIKTHKVADEYFNEYFDLVAHLMNSESNTTEDRYCVANVAENRVKSKGFEDTIYDVIFQPGQYEPTWIGTFYNEPSEEAWQAAEDYLRGRVETGMPEDVVFQSRSPQGDKIWKIAENGHYYCR